MNLIVEPLTSAASVLIPLAQANPVGAAIFGVVVIVIIWIKTRPGD